MKTNEMFVENPFGGHGINRTAANRLAEIAKRFAKRTVTLTRRGRRVYVDAASHRVIHSTLDELLDVLSPMPRQGKKMPLAMRRHNSPIIVGVNYSITAAVLGKVSW